VYVLGERFKRCQILENGDHDTVWKLFPKFISVPSTRKFQGLFLRIFKFLMKFLICYEFLFHIYHKKIYKGQTFSRVWSLFWSKLHYNLIHSFKTNLKYNVWRLSAVSFFPLLFMSAFFDILLLHLWCYALSNFVRKFIGCYSNRQYKVYKLKILMWRPFWVP
jgi:hypothetical protein